MEQWRKVEIKFEANSKITRSDLNEFIEKYVAGNPKCLTPGTDEFQRFGWIKGWDARSLSIWEDEEIYAPFGFQDAVLPFFYQLNSSVSGVRYKGTLAFFQNGGEFNCVVRHVEFDGKSFATRVDFLFDEDGRSFDDACAGNRDDPQRSKGGVLKSGRVCKKGNAFSWSLNKNGLLSIFAENPGDKIGGFEIGKAPWFSLRDKITSVEFSAGLSAVSLDNLFANCGSLEEVTGFDKLDSSKLTSMRGLFIDCEIMESVDLSGLDTSSVTDMGELFSGCCSLVSIDLSAIDTSKVTAMDSMFALCEGLESLDLSALNTASVESMKRMFFGLSLESIDLTGLDTSKVTDMGGMFMLCKELKAIDLSPLDTSNVTNMARMFENCFTLESLDLSPHCTSRVSNMNSMFKNCGSLKAIDLSSLDTSNVANMRELLLGCDSLLEADLSALDWSGVEDASHMFYKCKALERVDLSSPVATAAGERFNMFGECDSLRTVDLTGWDEGCFDLDRTNIADEVRCIGFNLVGKA